MQRQVQLIGAAWGLGGAHPACADAPDALAPLVIERLRGCGRTAAPGPVLRPERNRPSRQLALSRLCALLAVAALCGAREEPQVLADALDRH